MIFEPLDLEGAFRVTQERFADDRGWFARTYCKDEFAAHGLDDCSLQCSSSYNRRAGTLRGLHFQSAPHEETKLVRCARGAIWDVIVDLRPDSPTYKLWHGEELSAENGRALYIPKGFAHGFITLTDDVEVDYQMADPFVPAVSIGIAWDDPDIAVAWPRRPLVMSERDRELPALADILEEAERS
ncbi:MAG: dTDP-4-dehydrorhamnose 3,5-epimerase [Maricaulaceae bacterium]|jgi:dTDP-4-dehydrorhamnose 3,5-epimerase